jgi:hypothetical protein
VTLYLAVQDQMLESAAIRRRGAHTPIFSQPAPAKLRLQRFYLEGDTPQPERRFPRDFGNRTT